MLFGKTNNLSHGCLWDMIITFHQKNHISTERKRSSLIFILTLPFQSETRKSGCHYGTRSGRALSQKGKEYNFYKLRGSDRDSVGVLFYLFYDKLKYWSICLLILVYSAFYHASPFLLFFPHKCANQHEPKLTEYAMENILLSFPYIE